MKYRDEVEDELVDLPEGHKGIVGKEDTLRLIELGVRLGLEGAAEAALEAFVPVIPYQGDDGRAALSNAAKDIRAIQPADVMRRKP